MNNLVEVLPSGFLYLYIFLFGLCVGSFLNVAILRGLKGEDIVFGRSKCPKCKNQLKWYMNIPLLSYLFLRGKCAFCKSKISIQYPLIEFLNAAFYVFTFYSFGFNLKSVFICIYLSIFILLCATDFLETVILDYHSYLLAVVALIAAVFKCCDVVIIQSLVGAIAGFLFFEIVSRSGYLFVKQRIFGEGDSLIALGLGAIFGYKNLIVVIILSFIIQCIMAVPVLSYKALKENKIKLSISYIFVFLSMISVILINAFSLIQNEIYYLTYVIFITILLVYSLKNVLFEIKNKRNLLEKDEKITDDEVFEKSPYSLMPFGPAMIFAATICIFYLDKIIFVVKKFFC